MNSLPQSPDRMANPLKFYLYHVQTCDQSLALQPHVTVQQAKKLTSARGKEVACFPEQLATFWNMTRFKKVCKTYLKKKTLKYSVDVCNYQEID